jgi:TP901 family phage tail tape measure protein
MNLDAILRIKANVSGTGAVEQLGRGLNGLQKQATGMRGAMQSLAGSTGGLGSALQMLVPALSVAGLGAMANGAINTADNLNDLRQKTGVSVEALSQFSTAANMSGTTIESVAGAMNKLNKGLAAGAKSPAAGALRELGISATDATGKLRSTDAIMLDVADRFTKMPDGAQKAALAMKLFGKSGADMVPMLNMGGDAISKLGVTMSGEFAAQADEFNDKLAIMQADFSRIGVSIGTALMPALSGLADVLGGIVDAFSKLPAPIQGLVGGIALLVGAFVVLAPLITSAIGLISAIGPAVAGIVAAFSGLGGVLAAVGAAIAGFLTWPVLLVAGLVAAGVAIFVFRDQIGAFFQQVGRLAVEGWNALIAPLRPALDAIGQAFNGLVGVLSSFWTGAATVFYQLFIEPIVKSSQYLWGLITQGWNAVSGVASRIFSAIANAYQNIVVKPLVGAWTKIVDTAKAALRGLLGWAASAINGVINMVNRIIDGINAVRRLAGLSTFDRVGNVSVPAFAQGGYVTGPTLGLVGEAGREYIVPESKAAGFANNIMAGRRGAAAIPSGSSSSGGGALSINITTGPVRQDASGQRWMTIEDGEKMVRQAVGQMQRTSRTPGGRYASGVR